jgi:WD40 repeat protein
MNHEPLRYAHEPGHTDVCFSSDGSKFITCGADGDIRVWSTQEGEDPTHNCVGDWALSVRQKGANLYVATSSNDVQILTFPEGERNGVLDRFVAPINQITVSTCLPCGATGQRRDRSLPRPTWLPDGRSWVNSSSMSELGIVCSRRRSVSVRSRVRSGRLSEFAHVTGAD